MGNARPYRVALKMLLDSLDEVEKYAEGLQGVSKLKLVFGKNDDSSVHVSIDDNGRVDSLFVMRRD